MNLIGERILWILLGLVLGWVLCRLMSKSAVNQTRSDQHAEVPAPALPLNPALAEPVRDALPPRQSPSRMIDVGAARAAGFNLKHADDLTIIVGIGPKSDELLRVNSIESFLQVAQLHVDELLGILERGGPSFRLSNPASWAEQALLAAENRWLDLRRVQHEMMRAGAQSDE